MNDPLRPSLRFEGQVRSPFVTAGVEAAGIGIDSPVMRDEVGRPIIPTDHFKRLLREAFRALSEAMRPPPGPKGEASARCRGMRGGQPRLISMPSLAMPRKVTLRPARFRKNELALVAAVNDALTPRRSDRGRN
jgi:hypothetical protein